MNQFKHYIGRNSGIFYVLTVLAVFVLFSSIAFADSCSDTDGGIKYTVKGTTTSYDDGGTVIDSYSDECSAATPDLLAEFYCEGASLKMETYLCPTRCINGACDPAPDTCSYYHYGFSPPAGPLDGCATGFTCCMDTCLACGTGRTLCCSVDGDDGDCCEATEVCDEGTGNCINVNCSDPTDPNYCTICDFCYDNIQNCGETCIDGGGSCESGIEYTAGVYPVIDIFGIEESLLTDYLVEDVEIYYSDIFRCYDGIDNDYDCLIDGADPDCPSTPPVGLCIDADGDGYGLGTGCLGWDCDDSDPTIWVNCDTTPPELNMTINNNDTYANKLTVTLNLEYDDDFSGIAANGCMFSNDGVFDTEVWQPCANAIIWTLAGPDGANTVHAKIKDNDGNVNDTESDSIILDTLIPSSNTVVLSDPAPSFSNITFDVSCTDTLSGCNSTVISIDIDSCTVNHTAGDVNCIIKLPVECETKTYYYTANTTDNAGNINETNSAFDVKKKDGCDCISSDECYDGACIGMSYCANLAPPEIDIEFTGSGDTFEIPLGKTRTLLIKLKNPLGMPDSIELSIYGNPINIKYWSYFEGQKYKDRTKKIVHLGPRSEISVPLNVLGGKVGEYMLRVEAKSITNSQKASKDIQVSVISVDKDGYATTTPGLGVVGLLLLILMAALMSTKEKSY